MSAPGFRAVLALRLQELEDHLVAEHEFAVQQAVGHRSQQLALENAMLRSEIRALQQRMASRPTDHCTKSPQRAQRPPASPGAFKALLEYLYNEEEALEVLSSLLPDAALCSLHTTQKGWRWCIREMLLQRKARLQQLREPLLRSSRVGAGVTRTTSNSSLVSSTRASEVEWISIAEPVGNRRSQSASPQRGSPRTGAASPGSDEEPPPPTPALRSRSAPVQDSSIHELQRNEGEGRVSAEVEDLRIHEPEKDEDEGGNPEEIQDSSSCEPDKDEGEGRAAVEMQDLNSREPDKDEGEGRAAVVIQDLDHCEPEREEEEQEGQARAPAEAQDMDSCEPERGEQQEEQARAPEEVQDLKRCEPETERHEEEQQEDLNHCEPERERQEEEEQQQEESQAEPAEDALRDEAAGLPVQQESQAEPAEDALRDEAAGLPMQQDPDPDQADPEDSGEDEPQAAERTPQPKKKVKGSSLTTLLVKAKPLWSSRDRMAAQTKLAKVGVRTVEDLAGALKNKLNDRLREAGSPPFNSSTLQALTKCVNEYPLNGTEVATNGNAKVEAVATNGNAKVEAVAGVNGKAAEEPAELAKGEDTLLGLWVGDDGRFSYEIRSLVDGGFRQDLGPAGVPPSAKEHGTGLFYFERNASGEVLAGLLERSADTSPEARWPWEAGLQDGSRLRFRLDFGKVLVSEKYIPGSFNWTNRRNAERPQAYAFYNAMEQKEGHRYVHLASEGGGVGEFPLVGLTAGWVPASLAGDKENAVANHTQVSVKLMGSFCDPFDVAQPRSLHTMSRELAANLPERAAVPMRGRGSEARGRFPFMQERDDTMRVARHYGVQMAEMRNLALFRGRVRKLATQACKRDLSLTMGSSLVRIAPNGAPPRPLLSIIVVRYYDYWSDARHSSDYNILNDGFFIDLFTGPNSPCKILASQVEIYTVFIRSTADLAKLRAGHLRALLKGVNVTAWYFLWPSGDGVPGEVTERVFFRLCQDMERLPIRMGWPHQSSLYRLLCGKLWIPQMSLNRKFRVPPTVRVHYAEFRRNPRKAAERALESLLRLRKRVWEKPDGNWEDFKGVVKLGFSWCGSDVLPFRGISSLVKNLGKLLNHRRCENTMCLVQEMVPDVVGEFRVLVMHDKGRLSMRRETMWMDQGAPCESCFKHNINHVDVGDFSMATHLTVDPREVARRFFHGDKAAQLKVEDQALSTVDHWMKWYATENPEPPQSTRIDFLVGHSRHGEANVWTCEVGENGGSLCNVEVHGRNLAALNRAVIKDGSGRFPLEFPSRIPKNNGEKG